jgi:hypothetical protein
MESSDSPVLSIYDALDLILSIREREREFSKEDYYQVTWGKFGDAKSKTTMQIMS